MVLIEVAKLVSEIQLLQMGLLADIVLILANMQLCLIIKLADMELMVLVANHVDYVIVEVVEFEYLDSGFAPLNTAIVILIEFMKVI